jgi:hypothetical protein
MRWSRDCVCAEWDLTRDWTPDRPFPPVIAPVSGVRCSTGVEELNGRTGDQLFRTFRIQMALGAMSQRVTTRTGELWAKSATPTRR